jgi:hypothetical protein
MPAPLIRRIAICLLIASPAIAFRVLGLRPDPVLDLIVFGTAVVASAFLLAWAAEAAQKDISGALAIAILAFIAVLPEYAVDLYYAFRSGTDPGYAQFAAANMTGSNRLLLGFGWPLVVLVALAVARRTTGRRTHVLRLPGETRVDIGFLAILAALAFAVPILGSIPIWLGGRADPGVRPVPPEGRPDPRRRRGGGARRRRAADRRPPRDGSPSARDRHVRRGGGRDPVLGRAVRGCARAIRIPAGRGQLPPGAVARPARIRGAGVHRRRAVRAARQGRRGDRHVDRVEGEPVELARRLAADRTSWAGAAQRSRSTPARSRSSCSPRARR